MKRFFSSVITTILIFFWAFDPTNAQTSSSQTDEIKTSLDSKKSIVLLELFTSEGCPTCPPADANLARLEKEQFFENIEIITLALHVDYWNSTRWKDEYSSPIFSRRQQIYSQALKLGANYTPQMIVDGQMEFAGNNLDKAQKSISDAAKNNKAKIEITPTNDKYIIKISDVPAHQNATIFLAVAEDDLISNRKNSGSSNNKTRLVSVVRELKSLGMLSAEQTNLELETVLQIQPKWKRENLKLVVFVQENASRKIFGVSRIKIN